MELVRRSASGFAQMSRVRERELLEHG